MLLVTGLKQTIQRKTYRNLLVFRLAHVEVNAVNGSLAYTTDIDVRFAAGHGSGAGGDGRSSSWSVNLRLPTAYRRPPGHRLQTADRRPTTAERQTPTADRRPPAGDRRLPTAEPGAFIN